MKVHVTTRSGYFTVEKQKKNLSRVEKGKKRGVGAEEKRREEKGREREEEGGDYVFFCAKILPSTFKIEVLTYLLQAFAIRRIHLR